MLRLLARYGIRWLTDKEGQTQGRTQGSEWAKTRQKSSGVVPSTSCAVGASLLGGSGLPSARSEEQIKEVVRRAGRLTCSGKQSGVRRVIKTYL